MNVSYVKSKQNCIVCESDEFVVFYSNQRTFELINSECLVFRQELESCYQCGLVRQVENESYSDENLNKYYANTYRTPIQIDEVDKNDKRVINAHKRLNFIQRLKNAGTLLEVGFGDGIFLAEASSKFKCVGLDVSEGYSYVHQFLQEKQVEIFNGQIEDFPQQKKFDVVCAFLVLEHIKQPLQFIEKLKRHLESDGVLIIEVPDIECYKSFNSESLLTHEHLYHYTIETLANLLAKENLGLMEASNKDISYGFSLIAAFKNGSESPPVLPKGFHSLALFQEFIEMRHNYQQNMRKNLAAIIRRVKDINGTIAVYGTGFLFSFAAECCIEDLEKIDYFFDDTTQKAGKNIGGKTILPLKEIGNLSVSAVIIFSETFFEFMKSNIVNIIKNRDIEIIDIHRLSL